MADLTLAIKVTATDDTGAVLDSLNRKLARTKEAAGKLGGRAGGGLGRVFGEASRSIETLGNQAERLAAGPLQSATDYESAIANIRTLVDEATISTSELEQMTQQAAARFGGKPQKQAAALYDIISAGAKDATQAQEVLDASNRFAVAGLTDTQTAAKALTKSLANFSDQGVTASQASDVLFAAVKDGQTTAGELARSFPKVANAAGGAGLSIEQAASAYAILTRTAGSSSEASTQFAGAIGNILKPSQQAQKALAQLRRQGKEIDFGGEALRTKGIAGFFAQFEGVGDDTLVRIFGSKKGAEAARALIKNNADLVSSFENARDAAGLTAEAEKIQANTRAQQLKRAEAAFENLKIEIGNGLIPVIDELLPDIQQGVKDLAAFVKNNRELVGTLAKVGLGVVVLSKVIGAVRVLSVVGKPAVTVLGGLAKAVATATSPASVPALTQNVAGLGLKSVGAVAAVAGLAFGIGTLIDQSLGLSDKIADALTGFQGRSDVAQRGSPGFRKAGAVDASLVRDGKIITDAAQRRQAAAGFRRRLTEAGVTDAAEQRIRLRSAGFRDADFTSGGARGGQQQRAQLDVKVGIDETGRPTARVRTGGDAPVNLEAGVGVAT